MPAVILEVLTERLEEYLADLSSSPDPAEVATDIVATIEAVAQELEDDIGSSLADGIVARLEASGELDASLLEVLEEAIESDEDFDFTAEEVVHLIERICEVRWVAGDEDEDEDEVEDDDDNDEVVLDEDEDF